MVQHYGLKGMRFLFTKKSNLFPKVILFWMEIKVSYMCVMKMIHWCFKLVENFFITHGRLPTCSNIHDSWFCFCIYTWQIVRRLFVVINIKEYDSHISHSQRHDLSFSNTKNVVNYVYIYVLKKNWSKYKFDDVFFAQFSIWSY